MKASVSRALPSLQAALAISLTIAARAQTNTLPSSGNVGIGTTSPSFARLQIGTPSGSDTFGSGFDVAGKSQVEVSYNGITEVLRLSNYSGASAGIGPRLTFASNNNELTAAITGVFDGGTNGQLRFDTETSGVLTEKLRITSAGNVGIGTTTPVARLNVYTSGQQTARFDANDSSGGFISFFDSSGSVTRGYVGYGQTLFNGSASITNADFGIRSQGGIAFGSIGSVFQYITPEGNVGLGTTNPGTYKLAVNGQIHAKEVVVETGWSDYVFENGYKLPALSEVERHIKAEHHLPGIPSAQEVSERGVSMGEMQSKLLAKIEELTLHQIEQEKRLGAQQNEIAALRNQLRSLSHD